LNAHFRSQEKKAGIAGEALSTVQLERKRLEAKGKFEETQSKETAAVKEQVFPSPLAFRATFCGTKNS